MYSKERSKLVMILNSSFEVALCTYILTYCMGIVTDILHIHRKSAYLFGRDRVVSGNRIETE